MGVCLTSYARQNSSWLHRLQEYNRHYRCSIDTPLASDLHSRKCIAMLPPTACSASIHVL
jgi:hypothetical protein